MIRQNTMTKEEIKAALLEHGVSSFKKQAGFIPQKLQEKWPVRSNVKDNGMYFTVAAIRVSIQTQFQFVMPYQHEFTIVVEGVYCHVTVNEHNIRLGEGDIPF
jgi:hypothetical protein